MKIAICDDIKEYRNTVRCYTADYMKMHSIDYEFYEFDNGTSLLSSDTIFDILFLDIELGDSNGINIAKQLQQKSKNTVILIITSYRQYLDDAMDINVTRYIDKPISQERINSSLDKAVNQINNTIITVHLKNDSSGLRVKFDDIVYVEASLKRVTVFTKKREIVIKESLRELKSLLTGTCFAIPHSSFIVNLSYIKFFKREEIFLAEPYSNVRIAVSSRKQPEFKRKFLNYIGEDSNND